jgi:hypothetical protein
VSWQRVTIRAIVFALIGAAMTVLVAWAVYFTDPNLRGAARTNDTTAHKWPRSVPSDWPANPDGVITARKPASAVKTWHAVVPDFETVVVHLFAVRLYSSGWPLRSMRSERTLHLDRDAKTPIPWLPLWPGFLVDTAFWGGAAFIVCSVPGFVRRGVRRRRGRCVRCGYELKGLAVCPECGGAA